MFVDCASLGANGWLLATDNSRPLFQIPPECRVGLQIPRSRGAFGETEIELDASRFVYGTEWAKCKLENESNAQV
jgi:hypothetical protein